MASGFDPGESLSVATFNLNNLCSPSVPVLTNSMVVSPEDYAKKIDWTAEQLRRMNADIVGVQEVIHLAALQEAVDKSGVYPGVKAYVAGENGQYPCVGVISRLPLLDVQLISVFPKDGCVSFDTCAGYLFKEFTRPVLKVEIELEYGQRIAIVIAHLKSMRPDIHSQDKHDPVERAMGKARSQIRRTAEAVALRCSILKLLETKDTPVILLGDLNDVSGSTTTEIITGTPPWRSLSGYTKQSIKDLLLYDVTELQSRRSEQHAYYTHIYNGRFECLDHIMVSGGFAEENGLGTVNYVRHFTDHLLDETISPELMPHWQSDHGQVMANLRVHNLHIARRSASRASSTTGGRHSPHPPSGLSGSPVPHSHSSPAPARGASPVPRHNGKAHQRLVEES